MHLFRCYNKMAEELASSFVVIASLFLQQLFVCLSIVVKAGWPLNHLQ